MKNLLIITGLIFSGSVFAQSSSNTCKRMDKMENILKDSIKITSEQQSKISTLHATYCPKFKAIGSSDKSKDEKKSEMKTLNKELKSKYKEILTEVRLGTMKEKYLTNPNSDKALYNSIVKEYEKVVGDYNKNYGMDRETENFRINE